MSVRRGWRPFAVLVLAALVYVQYGFEGKLKRDDAIYVYSGQRMADGVPPYRSVFDHKGPLAPMIAGLAVGASRRLGLDDLFTVRAVFFVAGSATALAVLLLGRALVGSERAGLLAALAFLGFFHFGRAAASGPDAKVPMVLFQTLCLWFTVEKRWLWAGLAGSLAFLTWQPALVFPAAALFLAALQPGKARFGAALRVLAGVLLPLLLVVSYFHGHGALGDLADGFLLFNIRFLDRGPTSFFSHFWRPVEVVLRGYVETMPVVLIGLGVLIREYPRGRSRHSSLRAMLARDPFGPVFLTFPAPFAWSLLDFQGKADFFVFLPYAALGFGKFLDGVIGRWERSRKGEHARLRPNLLATGVCAGLVLFAGLDLSLRRESGLEVQEEAAREIEEGLGAGGRLLTIGVPEVLVLLHRTNPTRYVFVINGIDRYIDANTPGGFPGWLEELAALDPNVIVFGSTKGRHLPELTAWLESRYEPEQVGPWMSYRR